MAENKKSFVLYADLISTFEELEDVEAGLLVKHLLRYVNDQNPEAPNRLIKLLFEPIKLQLKRDLHKWEEVKENKSQGGQIGNLKRWNVDIYERYTKGEISVDEALKIAESRRASHTDKNNRIPIESVADGRTSSDMVASVAVTVNDTVNENVTVTVNENVIKKDNGGSKRFSPPTHTQVYDYFIEKINDTFWSESEANHQAEKFMNFYSSKNWMVGKNKMSIWKSAAANWVLTSIEKQTNNGKSKTNTSSLKSNNGTAAPKDFGQL
ncbi:DUF6291 domain-containing protein [Pedobacter sp. Leaf170]|uniref:DUF6291 domain-containing protein n=1 Tax=Pedobacter sp. Leaf170 TaxID=2876558 RepID=UPI001E3272D4|nr:DUF6291 domain-containing protein [Pedobacter sp. Leaf170]